MPMTVNELSQIKKLLETEQVLIKKFTLYSTLCSDRALQMSFEEIAAEHRNHYNSLISLLN